MTLSAKQTAAIIPAGGLVSGCSFLLMLVVRKPHSALFGWTAAGILGLLIVGFLISQAGGRRLESGIAQERWPAADIEALRSMVSSTWFSALHVALIILLVVCAVVQQPARSVFWGGFMLVQSLTMLRSLLKTPAIASNSGPKWSDLKPLHSSHWGDS